MLKNLKLTLFLLVVSALPGCGQQESDHFDLEVAKQKWGSSGVLWTDADLQLLESGESLYRSNYSVCHARDGKGDMQLGCPSSGWQSVCKRAEVSIDSADFAG